LEKSIRLCETAFGILWTYEGELFSPAAVQGPAAFLQFYRDKQRLQAVPGSWLPRHGSGGDVGGVGDIADEPYFWGWRPRRRRLCDIDGPAERRHALGGDPALSSAGATVFRQTSRTIAEFRRAGGNCNRECATVQ